MKALRIWILLAAIAALSGIFGYYVTNRSQVSVTIDNSPLNPESIGMEASAIFRLTLSDPSGRPQALEHWRGKILVVNYWATWCPPCRQEMPGFARLQEKFFADGVQFVGISIDTAIKVAEFQKVAPVNYPLLIGDASAIDSSVALGNTHQALPFTVVIDRRGMIAAVKLGRFAEADLDRQLGAMI